MPSCQQHDFLPFTCDACNQIFCLEHRQYADHDCKSFQKQDKLVPICPLCNQPVPWYPVDAKTVDEVVDNHIRTQKCSAVRQPMSKNNEAIICQAPSCKNSASLKCKFCNNHRNELDHPCSRDKSNGASTGANSSNSSSIYAKQNSKLAQIHQQKLQTKPSTSSTASKPLTNIQKMKVLESKFGNLKTKPIGQETIEREDRIMLDVYFPLDSNQAPLHMFFSKNWRVGKVLDRICIQGKVENKNSTEQDVNKRLNLFHVHSYLKLPTDKTFQELLNANQIKQNDCVILERGEELKQDVREAIENTRKNPEQATCIIN